MLLMNCFLWFQEDQLSEERDKFQAFDHLTYTQRRFWSYINEKFFTDLESSNLVQEKTVELEDPGEYSDVA